MKITVRPVFGPNSYLSYKSLSLSFAFFINESKENNCSNSYNDQEDDRSIVEEDGKITFDDYVGLSTGQKRTTYFTNYSGYSFYPETHNSR